MTIIHTIQEIIRHEMRRSRVAEMGLVEAVYPHAASDDQDNYGCDVRLKNSGLLLKRVPIATGHIGTAAIPNQGDLVLLVFDKGDVNQPIVIGRLYNDEDRPPINTSNEVIFRLPLAESDDNTLKAAIRNLPNGNPKRQILVEMTPKISLDINDGTIHAVAGKSEMKLDQTSESGGTVTAMAGRTKITMDQDGDITIEAAGSMTLKATRDLNFSAQNISLKSQLKTQIEAGTQASLKSKTGATVDGGLSATVQGATTTIKGITSFSP